MRKVVDGFGKKVVSTGVRKPGNMCVTDRHDMILAVKVMLKPNTTTDISLDRQVLALYCRNPRKQN